MRCKILPVGWKGATVFASLTKHEKVEIECVGGAGERGKKIKENRPRACQTLHRANGYRRRNNIWEGKEKGGGKTFPSASSWNFP